MRYFLLINILNTLIFSLHLTESYAASFDCLKATLKAEKTICEDEKLSRLDDELSIAYSEIKGILEKNGSGTGELIMEQRSWLNQRNGCFDNKCIEKKYRDQLLILKAWALADGAPRGSGRFGGALSRLERERIANGIEEKIEGLIFELNKIDTNIVDSEAIAKLVKENNDALINLIDLKCSLARRSYLSTNSWASTHISQCKEDQFSKYDKIVNTSYLCVKKLNESETIGANEIGACLKKLSQPIYE